MTINVKDFLKEHPNYLPPHFDWEGSVHFSTIGRVDKVYGKIHRTGSFSDATVYNTEEFDYSIYDSLYYHFYEHSVMGNRANVTLALHACIDLGIISLSGTIQDLYQELTAYPTDR